jgi:tetratricopeptide (TPR) repeat protein
VAEEQARQVADARLAEARRLLAQEEASEAQERREAEEEAELLERAALARETSRLARLKEESDALARAPDARRSAGTPSGGGPSPLAPRPMQEVVGGGNPEDKALLARHRQQSDLVRQMNEALKRSVSEPSSAPTPPEPTLRREEKTDPAIRLPTQPLPPPPARPSAPRARVFGGDQRADNGDLWNMAPPVSTSAPVPGNSGSFEEALRRVDTSLEALVGRPDPGRQAAPVEPLPDAELSSPTPVPALPEANLDDPLDPAEQGKLRRQRLLRRAMESLGSMGASPASSPSAVVAPISSSPSGVTARPSTPAAPPSAPASRASAPPLAAPSRPSAAAPVPTPAEAQLAAQIETRAEAGKKKDHYATLGITPQATRDQVKAAFLGLAKTFHPDRLPPSLPHLKQKISTVFEAIREAYETLYDDNRRTAYTATLAAAKAKANQAAGASPQQATDLFKMGEVFFKKRDYKQAEDHFARAHASDQGANSLAAQAWAIYMDPARKAESANARAMMQKALALDAKCDRALYQLGVIARVEGDMDRAEKYFREAVRVNPRHLEASQEIRLIEMRRKKEKDSGKKGGGLFG